MVLRKRTILLPLLLLLALLSALTSQAQLSCEQPPPPFDDPQVLANWKGVWNLTDVCLSVEGVFGEIFSGGVGRDGIPPIDNPLFDDLETADTVAASRIARHRDRNRWHRARLSPGDSDTPRNRQRCHWRHPDRRDLLPRSAIARSSSTVGSRMLSCASVSAACCATAT